MRDLALLGLAQEYIFVSTVEFPVSTLVEVFVGALWCAFQGRANHEVQTVN